MALLDTNKRYNPNELAGFVGGAGETWSGKEFFVGGEKYRIQDNGDGTRSIQPLAATKSDIQSGRAVGNIKPFLVDEISNQLIELENKYAAIPGVSLTQEEMDAFLNKALDQITPYYEAKKTEIEKGIKEGKIRTAEDTLSLIERVKTDVKNNFARYDIDQAQSEEEFINKMADITASSSEATDAKRFEWKQRLDDAKMGLNKQGILSSGIGQKEIANLDARRQEELAAIQRRTQQSQTESETAKKFSLDRIRLARQAITDERNRRIGEPTSTDQLAEKARGELGLTSDQPIGSEADIAYQRAQRNTKVYDPTALSDLEEERRTALESRNLSLKQEEIDRRTAEEKAQRDAINAQMAAKQRDLQNVRGY